MKITKGILSVSIWMLATFVSYSQNVVIQQNSVDPSSQQGDGGAYYINGISTREDIGGVEVSVGDQRNYGVYFVKFKNYNNIPVSVIYQLEAGMNERKKVSGTIILQAGEEKQTGQWYYDPNNYVLIVRAMPGGNAMPGNGVEATNKTSPVLLYNAFYVSPDDFAPVEYEVALEMIGNLNRAAYCGYGDWRLPSESELSLIKSSPSYNSKLTKDFYWDDRGISRAGVGGASKGRVIVVRTNK